jgi:hypothetical protein
VIALLARHPGAAAAGGLILALAAGHVYRAVQVANLHTAAAHQEAVISTMRAAVQIQNEAVDQWQAAADKARQDAARARAKAKADSATRAPAIAALTTAEAAPAAVSGAALTCNDAVDRIRDALGR